MSAVIIHHGHIRLIKKQVPLGKYTLLSPQTKKLKRKKIVPELNYNNRKEILLGLKYVKVIPCPWLIDNKFIKKHNIDYLVHGNDNENPVFKKKILIFKRTKGISTWIIRKKCYNNLKKINASRKRK